MKLIFATHNQDKAREISNILSDRFQILTLDDIGITEDIPETADTLEGNALQKVQFVWKRKKLPVFADDTGLEVEALGGLPGAKSARYAGAQKDNIDNMKFLIKNMRYLENRKAQFRTCIALIWEEKEYLFEGIVKGHITEEMKGKEGFGYDPIFVPEGDTRTFAEMTLEEKNAISHRALAMEKLIAFIKEKI